MNQECLPSALEVLPQVREQVGRRLPAFFLDFDGTLAPIVSRPEMAKLPASTKTILVSLAKRHLVCIMSGRGLEDLRQKVGIPALYYGADHGRHILGPAGSLIEHEVGGYARPDLRAAAEELRRLLTHVEGSIVETKDLSLSLHYRLTAEVDRPHIEEAVRRVVERFPSLQLGRGAMVYELRPDDRWNKGQAMLWLLDNLGLRLSHVCPLCLGDDLTDEDMFRAAGSNGVSVIVGETNRSTRAQYALADPAEAARFLGTFAAGESVWMKRGYD